MPESVAGPQSLMVDIDLVEALPVRSHGPSSAEDVQGEEVGVMTEVM